MGWVLLAGQAKAGPQEALPKQELRQQLGQRPAPGRVLRTQWLGKQPGELLEGWLLKRLPETVEGLLGVLGGSPREFERFGPVSCWKSPASEPAAAPSAG